MFPCSSGPPDSRHVTASASHHDSLRPATSELWQHQHLPATESTETDDVSDADDVITSCGVSSPRLLHSDSASPPPGKQPHPLFQETDTRDHRKRTRVRTSREYSKKRIKNVRHSSSKSDSEEESPLILTLNAPGFLEGGITLVLSPVTDLLSPGFVIQRVQGNSSWLEEVGGAQQDCYFTGYVRASPRDSNVALSLCSGVVSRQFIH